MHDTTSIRDAAGKRSYIPTVNTGGLLAKLPPLIEMAAQVESIHFGEENVPEALSDVLHQLFVEMEAHMKGQEATLFPAPRESGDSGIDEMITTLRAEHDRLATSLSEIRGLTCQFIPPEGACRMWTALYADLAEFIVDLEEQMRMETEVLAARFESRI